MGKAVMYEKIKEEIVKIQPDGTNLAAVCQRHDMSIEEGASVWAIAMQVNE